MIDVHFVLSLPVFFLPDLIAVTTVLISPLSFTLHMWPNREGFLFFTSFEFSGTILRLAVFGSISVQMLEAAKGHLL